MRDGTVVPVLLCLRFGELGVDVRSSMIHTLSFILAWQDLVINFKRIYSTFILLDADCCHLLVLLVQGCKQFE